MNENLVAAVQHLHAAVAALAGLLPAGHVADWSLQRAAVALRRLADEAKPEPVMTEEQIEALPDPLPGDTYPVPHEVSHEEPVNRAGPPTSR